ncbi:SH3 domain-containing protein [Endothiovibrio diazotrophicus]
MRSPDLLPAPRMPPLLFALLLSLAEAGHADTGEGLDAYRRGAYGEARTHWEPMAAGGDATAQCYLGYLYEQGLGVKRDLQRAVSWYRNGATDAPLCQRSLGLLYRDGRGVGQDLREAVRWFRRAAFRGDTPARRLLGEAYLDGQGVARSESMARAWFRQAADQGDRQAAAHLDALRARSAPVAADATAPADAPMLATTETAATAAPPPGVRYRVLRRSVRLRAQPGTHSEVIGGLEQGEIVDGVMPAEEGWVKVRRPATGQTGYVAQFLLAAEAAP